MIPKLPAHVETVRFIADIKAMLRDGDPDMMYVVNALRLLLRAPLVEKAPEDPEVTRLRAIARRNAQKDPRDPY